MLLRLGPNFIVQTDIVLRPILKLISKTRRKQLLIAIEPIQIVNPAYKAGTRRQVAQAETGYLQFTPVTCLSSQHLAAMQVVSLKRLRNTKTYICQFKHIIWYVDV